MIIVIVVVIVIRIVTILVLLSLCFVVVVVVFVVVVVVIVVIFTRSTLLTEIFKQESVDVFAVLSLSLCCFLLLGVRQSITS